MEVPLFDPYQGAALTGRTSKYVGLDVHQATTVASVRERSGRVILRCVLPTMKTPWRFRTKRHLWAYAGLAVVTENTAEHRVVGGHVVRRRRKSLTRGLTKNHNPILKDVFKGAATAAIGRPGPFQDLYLGTLERGMREEMARGTLARQ